MKRRSVTAALATAVLALSVALIPAASASAAGNGSITVYNTCGHSAAVSIYSSVGTLKYGTTLAAGAHRAFILAPGTYAVTTSPTITERTVRSGQGWAVRLCR